MANPRIDELRTRLQREPGSRLFAQLAEELRKDGDLTEAIRVARGGLAVHPNYPSARLTLGRALIESGNLTAARSELESVLRGAPDNILASRMLAECLEALGDLGAALLQFRAALRLSPGDRQIEGQVRALEQRLAGGTPAAVRPAVGPAPVAPGLRATPAPPTAVAGPTLVSAGGETTGPARPAPALPVRAAPAPTVIGGDFEDVFEAPPSWTGGVGAPPAPDSAPILLLEDEAPTMPGGPAFMEPASSPPDDAVGRPDTAAFPAVPQPAAPVTLAFAKPTPAGETPASETAVETPAIETRAVLARPPEQPPAAHPATAISADTLAGAPAFPIVEGGLGSSGEVPFGPGSSEPAGPGGSAAAVAGSPPRAAPFTPPAGAAGSPPADTAAAFSLPGSPAAALFSEAPAPEVPPPGAPAPPLRSATLAELYLEQGFPEKAASVYEEMLESDPYDQRARARLIEIKRMAATTPAFTSSPSPLAPGAVEAAVPAVPGRPLPEEDEAPPAPAEAVAGPPVDDPNAPRRRALERTIKRLEQMLVAVRRE